MMFWWTFLVWVFLTWTTGSIKCQEPFQDLMKSSRKLADYYMQQYGNMNLDGIYGLRVLEGKQTILKHKSQVNKN